MPSKTGTTVCGTKKREKTNDILLADISKNLEFFLMF